MLIFTLVGGGPKSVEAHAQWHTLTMPKSRPAFKLGSESLINQLLLLIVAVVIPKILGSLSKLSTNNFRSCALFTALSVMVHKKVIL